MPLMAGSKRTEDKTTLKETPHLLLSQDLEV